MAPRPADTLNIALAQLNPTVGDVAGNAEKVRRARDQAAALGADLVAFPELFLAGYPPEDLVLKPAFQAACRAAVEALARESVKGPGVLVGTPWVEGGKLYNAYVLLNGGVIEAVRFKVDLPNYGVFDEKRVFEPGPMPGPILVKGVRIGIPICEDIWGPEVVECLSETGGEILLVPNGSPYWRGKTEHRLNIAVARVVDSELPLIYLNMVGGQDELVFDGASFVLNADRTVGAQLPAFREDVALTRWRRDAGGWHCAAEQAAAQVQEGDKADYAACVMGLRDYVEKNGFKGVVLGLSGGIDSALCAAMATDALGAKRVRCIMLPYRYTSQESLDDAACVAKALGVTYDILPIEQAVLGLEAALKPAFEGQKRDVTEENLQARARGTILMAHFQQVRPDGGDDRQQVGNVGRLRHALRRHERRLQSDQGSLQDRGFSAVAPAQCLEAGRRARARGRGDPGQHHRPSRRPRSCARTRRTRTRCRPTTMLDQMLERLVEREEPVASIVAAGFDRDTVVRVERMLNLAEYKRRQAAPGVKVTLKNFGRDRRYPIVNRFRDPGTPLPEPDKSLLKNGGVAKTEAFDF